MAGLIAFKTVDELQQEEFDRGAAGRAQSDPIITGLASHIRTVWMHNKNAKTEIERRMIENIRQRKGEYDPVTLQKIRQYGGSDAFIKLTDIKCKAVEGWLKDVMLPAGERPWGIDPTPISDIRPEDEDAIVQKMLQEFQGLTQQQGLMPEQALQAMPDLAEKMKKEQLDRVQEQAQKDALESELMVDDVLKEAGFYKALRALIKDIPTYPAVFLEGPVVENETQLEWTESEQGSIPTVVTKPKRKYYRISPFDVYPSPGAVEPEDGDLIVKKRFTRADLTRFKGVEGFDKNAIDLVLDDFRNGFIDWTATDSERADITNNHQRQQNNIGTIDALKYWGSVQGLLLLQWGMSPDEVTDPFAEYEIIAYMINGIVISARINPHPLKKRGIFSTSYCKNNESIWGESVVDVLRDLQKICNGAVRALVNNMGMCSGPQFWTNIDGFEPGENPSDIYPLKLWKFRTQDLQKGVPMGFFQPESNAEELIGVYKYFFEQASEITGIPSYMYGSPRVGGAGSTASGLSMLMEAAGKAMKDVVGSVDEDIIVPAIEETWLHIMLYEPEKAAGDIRIIARASDYLIQKETLQVRRQEFLMATNNPTDMQIIGVPGRAEILREVAGSLKLRKNKIVPDADGLQAQAKEQEMMQVAQTVAASLGLPVEVIIQAAQGKQFAGQVQTQNKNIQKDGAEMGGTEARTV